MAYWIERRKTRQSRCLVSSGEIPPHQIDTERQRQASPVAPPGTEISRLIPFRIEPELILADQDPGGELAGIERRQNPVKPAFAEFRLRMPQPGRKATRGGESGHRDGFGCHPAPHQQDRTAGLLHAGPRRQQIILRQRRRQPGDRDRREVIDRLRRLAVELRHWFQMVLKLQTFDIHQSGEHGVEHERIIRIRRMANGDLVRHLFPRLNFSLVHWLKNWGPAFYGDGSDRFVRSDGS
jgi:hypothetical protein